jgi:hypothetical protein
MEREQNDFVEFDVASIATKGPLGEPQDDFAGRIQPGLTRD